MLQTKRRSDFLKLKALIFDKKLRAKYNIDEEQLGKLLRKYAREYGTEDTSSIRHTLCDISNIDNYKHYEIQKNTDGQYYF